MPQEHTKVRNPGNRALVVLYIDPEAYESESGKPLSFDALNDYGKQAGKDAASMFGLESWDTIMPRRR